MSKELTEVLNEIRGGGDLWSARESLYAIRRKVRTLVGYVRDRLREIKVESRKLPRDDRELVHDLIEDVEDRVNDLIDEVLGKFNDVREAIRSDMRALQLPAPISSIVKITSTALSDLSRALSEALSDVRSEIEKGLSKGASSVISVRIPDEDLRIVDMLVEAGVFKSRSEAVAYFTHKGIKSSEELLKKIKERVDELFRLRSELERELGKS